MPAPSVSIACGYIQSLTIHLNEREIHFDLQSKTRGSFTPVTTRKLKCDQCRGMLGLIAK